jgi:hypothetical protein
MPSEKNTSKYRSAPMSIQARRLAMVTAILWFGSGVGGPASAGPVLMTPPGLNPGDQFRFVYVTDGDSPANSTNIGDYDNFVQTQAGGATYNATPVSFLAIGSTSSVNAIDHISQTNTPVYLSDGTLVSLSTTPTGLWSGSLLHSIDEDLTGQVMRTTVWTGTNQSGTSSAVAPLGSFPNVTEGDDTSITATWVAFELRGVGVPPVVNTEPVYGISQVLTVPGGTVPEPSSAVLAVIGAVCGVAYWIINLHLTGTTSPKRQRGKVFGREMPVK